MKISKPLYHRRRFPGGVIGCAVRWYFRFQLSLRDIGETDAEQTIALAHRLYDAPLLLIGESLGAGLVAAAGARQPDRTAGLPPITAWDPVEPLRPIPHP